ncbi:hypothetical protein B0J13DRAFT_646016 [Dactylonectria estremocensis]|uniref:C2H2-type domain-containing protein n=1 Tax=Dactylonectria estremocensis TaxID=1079267 RepID=A0A9P9DZM3_9HYPO|nr:hypothetical protein B0J13DRAFT_646016 [Dactylonectria estremocensis]
MNSSHKRSFDSKAVDTVPFGTANSENIEAPKKFSLRVLDGGHGPATREEDLSRGPLLLNIGYGFGTEYHQAIDSSTQAYLDGGDENSSQLYTELVLVPQMPLGSSVTVPSTTISHSDASTAGGSLSVPPTDGGSLTNFPPRALFPWRFEFSWQDSCLLFDGESFSVASAPQTWSLKASPGSCITPTTPPPSHPLSLTCQHDGNQTHYPSLSFDLAGVGGSATSLDSLLADEMDWELELAFGQLISFNYGPISSEAKLSLKQSLAALADELYDDFIRSYAPGRSQKRDRPTTAGDADAAGSNPDRKRAKLANSMEKTASAPYDGSEESDGEDLDDKRQGSARPVQYQSSFGLACPFFKWNHVMFEDCCRGFTAIRYLKSHIKETHLPPPPYCQNCYQTGFTGNEPNHQCSHVHIPPPGLLTPERVSCIQKRAERTKSTGDQWRHIYRTIFPDTPCPNPYLHFTKSEPGYVRDYYHHSERVRKLLQQGWPDELPAQFQAFFFEFFLPKFLSPFLPTDGGGLPIRLPRNLTRDEAQPVNPVLRNQTVKVQISPQVTDTYSWQFFLDSIGSGLDVGGDTNTASELLEILSSSELDKHDERQGTSNSDVCWLL